MRWGVSGAALPADLPNRTEVSAASASVDVPPALVYAIKWNETSDRSDAATVISGDGGRGLFQLTSSWPDDWADPLANAVYAVRCFIVPAITFWNASLGYTADDLVRCVAAEFNAGRGGAMAGHLRGDVDRYTTNRYAARALANYHDLVAGRRPS